MPLPPSAAERALYREKWRLGAVLGVLFAALGYLGAALHQEQVVKNGSYANASEAHSIRRVRLPATRGRILDRHGTVLAECAPDYTLGIFVEELCRPGPLSNTVAAVDAFVDELAAVVDRPRELTRAQIESHVRLRRPLALTAWRHLGPTELARFHERFEGHRGADIQILADRVYPLGDCAAHLIGYVGRWAPERPDDETANDAPEDFDYYLPDLVGRAGVERALDDELSGTPGGELVRIDAIGFKHADAGGGRAPVAGVDAILALDANWQRAAERELVGRRGAIAVVDVRTGEVPVLASSPRFDLSDFYPVLRPDTWRRLLEDPARPLVNRATQAFYAPGSTLKPFVALAALDAGVTTRGRLIECDGSFHLGGDSALRCARRFGHGSIDLETAIEQSCNVYFCQIGVDLGYEPALHDSLGRLGLGRRPDLEVATAAGILPTSDWKRRVHGDIWRLGDTANLSIGQGFLCVTPLQMAIATAAIANGGDILRPRLVLSPRPAADPGRQVVTRMPWHPASLAAVRRGMWRVVNAPEGGGRRASLDSLEIVGKTGTAEVDVGGGERRKNTWMIGYAPYREPKYAMAVVIEDGESGGKTAAPVLRHMFAALFGLDPGPDDDDPFHEYYDLPVPEEESEVGEPEVESEGTPDFGLRTSDTLEGGTP